ncbi:MAG TPA: hypothetical protein VLH84_01760 [Patescibacteria group bacterium]|nr:hypothetical protein [Patescibacteria group bacterium]
MSEFDGHTPGVDAPMVFRALVPVGDAFEARCSGDPNPLLSYFKGLPDGVSFELDAEEGVAMDNMGSRFPGWLRTGDLVQAAVITNFTPKNPTLAAIHRAYQRFVHRTDDTSVRHTITIIPPGYQAS